MSLEIRVETLEHELKILKNEIENTLLEIQNQVLIHYYPSLRAENSAPPKDLSALLSSSLTSSPGGVDEKRNSGHSAASEAEDITPAIMPPRTKEVSLHEIGSKSRHIPPRPAKASAGGVDRAVGEPAVVADQNTFAHLANWVNDAVARIGSERTQEIIESHANTEYCSPQIKDLLLQFVSLSEEEDPPEQVGTKELMDVLLKFNKVLHQIGKAAEPITGMKEKNVG